MNQKSLGDTTKRNRLLKMFLAKGMSSGEMATITQTMRDKSPEEKEMIAEDLYEKYGNMTLQQIRDSIQK